MKRIYQLLSLTCTADVKGVVLYYQTQELKK